MKCIIFLMLSSARGASHSLGDSSCPEGDSSCPEDQLTLMQRQPTALHHKAGVQGDSILAHEGKLSTDELGSIGKEIGFSDSESEEDMAADVLKKLDSDHSGFLEGDEIRNALQRSVVGSGHSADDLLKENDADHDGKISKSEVLKLIRQTMDNNGQADQVMGNEEISDSSFIEAEAEAAFTEESNVSLVEKSAAITMVADNADNTDNALLRKSGSQTKRAPTSAPTFRVDEALLRKRAPTSAPTFRVSDAYADIAPGSCWSPRGVRSKYLYSVFDLPACEQKCSDSSGCYGFSSYIQGRTWVCMLFTEPGLSPCKNPGGRNCGGGRCNVKHA